MHCHIGDDAFMQAGEGRPESSSKGDEDTFDRSALAAVWIGCADRSLTAVLDTDDPIDRLFSRT